MIGGRKTRAYAVGPAARVGPHEQRHEDRAPPRHTPGEVADVGHVELGHLVLPDRPRSREPQALVQDAVKDDLNECERPQPPLSLIHI